jgi:hypothetical protein
MNERIMGRTDRKNRFGDIRVRTDMDSIKLGRRDLSQCQRLFLRIMESIHATVEIKKEHH